MEDDLDELLDEVERKFCSKVSVSSLGRGGTSDGKKHENKAKDKETKGRYKRTAKLAKVLTEQTQAELATVEIPSICFDFSDTCGLMYFTHVYIIILCA